MFTVHTSRSGNNEFMINVGGIEIPAIIDSGATVNIIDRVVWEDLKHKQIKCKHSCHQRSCMPMAVISR